MFINKKLFIFSVLPLALTLITSCSHRVATDGENSDEAKVADTDKIDSDITDQKNDAISALENNDKSKEENKDELDKDDSQKEKAEIKTEEMPQVEPPKEEAQAPAPTPVPEEKTTTLASAPLVNEEITNPGEYRVKSGDTLMKISWMIYGDVSKWKKLKEWNNLSSSNVKPGTKLKYETPNEAFVPETNGSPYLIVTGDTLGKISTKVYDTPKKWKKIYENNRKLIKNPNLIFAGFTLYYVQEAQKLGEAIINNTEKTEETKVAAATPAASNNEDEIEANSEENPVKPPIEVKPVKKIKAKNLLALNDTKKAEKGPKPASIDNPNPTSSNGESQIEYRVPEAPMPQSGVSVIPKSGGDYNSQFMPPASGMPPR